MKTLNFEAIAQKHVGEAVALTLAAYEEERQAVPFLPAAEDFVVSVTEVMERVFSRGSGYAALAGDQFLGFLAGVPVPEFFGTAPGIYIPLTGHATVREGRGEICRGLYVRAAELWVRQGHTSHVLTLPAHDREAVETWFWLGFGLRCVDSLRETRPVDGVNPTLKIRKLKQEDISPELIALHREHCQYYNQSPIFMPRSADDPGRDMREWLSRDNLHLWAAYQEAAPLGYIRVQPEGESIISRHPRVMNVTSLYVSPRSRATGVGATLLNAVQSWLRESGWPLCGVDFESLNPLGSRFWNKHFTPYTYSLARRIDERAQ